MADDQVWRISPKELLAQRNLKARKRFGQNFLTDVRLAARIAAAVPARAHVIEIGGGTGTLTAALAQTAAQIMVLEMDRDLSALLQERFASTSLVQVLNSDALQFDFQRTLQQLPPPRALVGNLPYYITTPLLESIFACADDWDCAILMVQREYGRRLVAESRSANYSSLSAFASYFSEVRKLFDVGAAGFYPAPKVSSTVLHLTPRRESRLPVADERLLLRLIRASFAHRRKTVVNSILDEIPRESGNERKIVETALAQAALDPRVRAERLSLQDFVRLTDALAANGFSKVAFQRDAQT